MYVERLLQINLATLTALGAILLGMGEGNEWPPLVVVMAAGLSIWLTDVTGLFQISRRAANVLMLLAAAVSIGRIYPLHRELQVLDFAWFVIYLQVILLFQKKDERIYWPLVVLSLLQVLVATLFSQSIWFGLLLVMYMMLGFSAMALLLLHRQWEQCRPREPVGTWPQDSQRPETHLVCLLGGTGHSAVCGRLFLRLATMGFYTLLLAIFLFFAVPRAKQVTWQTPLGVSQTLVGFTESVKLGVLGDILDSRDKVLSITFADAESREHKQMLSDFYLQGTVLTNYNEGQWYPDNRTDRADATNLADTALTRASAIRTWCGSRSPLSPPTAASCFSFRHPGSMRIREDVSFRDDRQRLVREWRPNRRFHYELGTTAVVNWQQKLLVPATARDVARIDKYCTPSLELTNVQRLAKRWIAESGLNEQDRRGRATFLAAKLADPSEFSYSLASQNRDKDLDPIEDFLTEHRSGHCEYFATALVLMLRSVGIPARMIVGYKCSDWNDLTNCYDVRQCDAHAWVEAYLRPDQLPHGLLHGGDVWPYSSPYTWPPTCIDAYLKPDPRFARLMHDGDGWPWSENGGWYRLDPTPGGAVEAAKVSVLTPVRRALDRLDILWSIYVVELDFQIQRDIIYEPIGKLAKQLLQSARAFAASFRLGQLSGVVAWLAAIVAVVLAAAFLAGMGWLTWQMARKPLARWIGRHAGTAFAARAKIDFYRRFESLLARRGIRRTAGQTQREFAEAAGLRLAVECGQPALASLPGVIADAFYSVRFGHRPLDNRQAQAVEQALSKLAAIGKTK